MLGMAEGAALAPQLTAPLPLRRKTRHFLSLAHLPMKPVPATAGDTRSGNANILHLRISREAQTVTVHPENEDRFSLRVKDAIRACQAFADAKDFEERFRFLLTRLGVWVLGRKDIHSAFVTQRDGGFLFLVVRKTAGYDREFEDQLAELDVEIATDQDLRGVNMATLGLPLVSEEALSSFLSSSFVLSLVHGAHNGGQRSRSR